MLHFNDGPHRWAGDHHGKAAIERFLRDFVAAGLKVELKDLWLSGPPWRMVVIARLDDASRGPGGELLYSNRVVVVLRTRWGKIVRHDDFYEDTSKMGGFEDALRDLGIDPVAETTQRCGPVKSRSRGCPAGVHSGSQLRTTGAEGRLMRGVLDAVDARARMGAWIRRGAGAHPRLLVAAAMFSLVVGIALRETLDREPLAPSRRATHAHALAARGMAALPATLRGPLSAAMGADDPGYFATSAPARGARRAYVRPRTSASTFAPAGVTVRSPGARLSLGLRGIGYGGALSPVAPATPRAQANRVVYSHPGVSEWYANGPLGLEQGFTVARPPAAGKAGPLTLELSLSGSAPAVAGPAGKSFTVGSLGYTGLTAVDARGRLLPSHLRIAGGRLLLTVDAAGATYPLTVDPFVQQGPALTGSGESGNGRFGASVALSADGNTALVGGNFDNSDAGAAWVFTRSGETWTQQGPKLTGSEELGAGRFGSTVSLSDDGNTALIGGWADNGGDGRRLGLHPLWIELDPAGPEADRPGRDRHRALRHERGAVRQRQHGPGRRQSRQRRRGRRLGLHPRRRNLEPAGRKADPQRRVGRSQLRRERCALGRREHGADRSADRPQRRGGVGIRPLRRLLEPAGRKADGQRRRRTVLVRRQRGALRRRQHGADRRRRRG